MGASQSANQYDIEPKIVGYSSFTDISNSPSELVKFYSKTDFQGNIYEIEYGNYTSTNFIDKISPDNIFSLTVPSLTTVKLFCGDIFDYGGKGAFQITNITNSTSSVPQLPDNIQGRVRSAIIVKHNDIRSVATSVVDSSISGNASDANSQSTGMRVADQRTERFTEHFTESGIDTDTKSHAVYTVLILLMLLIVLICVLQ